MDELQTLRDEVTFLRSRAQAVLSPEKRQSLLIAEAMRWAGIHENGGNNRGELIQIFQRSSNIAPGDPWCMAFVQYCLRWVDQASIIVDPTARTSQIATGASCVRVWNNTAASARSDKPASGYIAIWMHEDGEHGHTGIVTVVDYANGGFRTIEGNTSPAAGVQREGDGVFQKTHSFYDQGQLELMGFLKPWAM